VRVPVLTIGDRLAEMRDADLVEIEGDSWTRSRAP
jgi:hypothetical protein